MALLRAELAAVQQAMHDIQTALKLVRMKETRRAPNDREHVA